MESQEINNCSCGLFFFAEKVNLLSDQEIHLILNLLKNLEVIVKEHAENVSKKLTKEQQHPQQ